MTTVKKTSTKTIVWTIIFALAILALLTGLFIWDRSGDQGSPTVKVLTGLSQILLSTYITLLFFLIITTIFGITDYKMGFLNFLIGDNGTYSLSRLQAVLWAVIIIAYQIGIIISLCANINGNSFSLYQPVFSETATWLLGLSLTSYVAVKGITTSVMASNPAAYSRQTTVPKLSDILVGSNGLDFSKCQMLLWTILAMIVFESKCYAFNDALLFGKRDIIVALTNHFYDEYNVKDKLTDISPYVPYIPWSFLVLMGLSQGVYVGKKLVPTFKLDDMKAGKMSDLQDKLVQLNLKKQLLSNILSKSNVNKSSAVDTAGIQAINTSIAGIQSQVDDLNKDINQINTYLNPS